MTKKLFCFGYGYSADYLARALRTADPSWAIAGTTRDHTKADVMAAAGVEAYVFSDQEPLANPSHALQGVTHILISTPPDDYGDPTARFHGDDIVQISTLKWVGYLSTTGVYGDQGGAWVDERSLVQPTSKRGTRRARAEEQWMNLHDQHGLPTHIFRLSGIYGPGRNALDSVRAGAARRINKPSHTFSRIHVEDIAQVLAASIITPKPGEVYNVSDDYPSASHEVIAYACEILGKPLPPLLDYASADLAPITMSFYSENKRIRNDKIKDTLGVTLCYPSFREGLLACRTAEEEGRGTSLAPQWFAEGRDLTLNKD